MISNDKAKYRSSSEWLSAVRHDEVWLNRKEKLLSADSSALASFKSKAIEELGNGVVLKFWEDYNHDVEKAIQEGWDSGKSLVFLKQDALSILTLEWLEKKEKEDAGTAAEVPENPKEKLNYFAPKRNLQELLKQSWFAAVRADKKYDAVWTDSFVNALMASEYGEGIARQWSVKGAREKKNQLKGYVVGLLKDARVLKGSYDAIARKVALTDEVRTFSKYMSQGKKQPYADWVKEWVAKDNNEE